MNPTRKARLRPWRIQTVPAKIIATPIRLLIIRMTTLNVRPMESSVSVTRDCSPRQPGMNLTDDRECDPFRCHSTEIDADRAAKSGFQLLHRRTEFLGQA